jgi:lipoprotein-releasing system permease protein
MTFSWFIAKRYLQATRKSGFVSFITGFSILGVTIGTAAVIVALSIISGFENEIKEKVFSFTSHVQVVGFQNLPLREYEQSLHIIKERIPDVVAIAPFVAKEAMIRAGDKVDGVLLKGIDPNNDLITVRGYLVEGRYLKGNQGEVRGQRPEVSELVIGGKLAAKLGVSIGDKVVLFGLPRLSRSEAETLHPRAIMFQVVGIFESGMAEYDDIYVYSTLNDAQRLFQLGNTIHGFDIIASDLTRASSVGSEIQKLLGYPHYARTAAQLYRNLFAWIELQKKPAPIFLGLIIIVAAVNIIGALLMLVLEKAQGIGVLKSVGAAPSDIRTIFLLQGTVIAAIGIFLGNVLAYVLCWVQVTFKPLSLPSDIYFMNTVPILIRPEHFIIVSIVVLLLCVAASFVPSRAAAQLDPTTTLRFT